MRLILHRGATTAERKGAAPTFAGDPGGMLVWQSDIRASLAMPGLDALDGMRAAMVAVVRAWVESALRITLPSRSRGVLGLAHTIADSRYLRNLKAEKGSLCRNRMLNRRP